MAAALRLSSAVLLLVLLADIALCKKRRAPKLPADVGDDCPFHSLADVPHETDAHALASELSLFGHELERDGRKREAMECYAYAIRAAPDHASGWFDLAGALQYETPPKARALYRHGLSLKPDGFHYNQLGILLRHARAVRQHQRLRGREVHGQADAVIFHAQHCASICLASRHTGCACTNCA